MREILFFFVFLTGLFVASCGTMTVNGGLRNSIYYTSEDVLPVKVEAAEQTAIAVNTDEETYEERLHKFDRLTYTVNVTIDPWYYTYWRWNYHYPYYYDFGWTWSWGPYYYYNYLGYYNPYRYRYHYYWYDWHRPYYTFYKPHRPHYSPNRDVRYTRRGGVTPSYRNNPSYRPNNGKPRPKAATSRTSNPARRATVSRSSSSSRNATVSRSSSQPRQATTSRKTNVRYNSSARPVSRSQSQTDRTGYSRSTTNNRSSNTGRTYYNNGPSQRTQPSVRYNERSTSSQNSGVSHSSGGGSSTRRK